MPELTLILPTLNERDNIRPILQAIDNALRGIDYEVIFVDDDSADGTASVIRYIAQSDQRVRVIQRIGRCGLASATIEGMLASSSPYLAVMDADLQHDEKLLVQMLERLRADRGLDMVIASRNIEGGSMGQFATPRVWLSNVGRKLSRWVCRTTVSDPMSGFFMLRREFLDEVVHRLSGIGFKILLDLIASSGRPVRFVEIPYTFRTRVFGESKLDIIVGVEYAQLLLDKSLGRWLPVTYLLFGAVGVTGVVVHLLLLLFLVRFMSAVWALAISGVVVIALNFYFNNRMTFRANRLKGRSAAVGFVLFLIACGIGLAVNIRVASALHQSGVLLPIAGLAGILIGSVWNYWMSSVLVWRVQARRSHQAAAQPALSLHAHIPE